MTKTEDLNQRFILFCEKLETFGLGMIILPNLLKKSGG